jgi:hypothetical protein
MEKLGFSLKTPNEPYKLVAKSADEKQQVAKIMTDLEEVNLFGQYHL